ncbi:hypothetical protein IMZ48_45720, partial [Candidatus Bathyarchaeota archaeon]|nr:hypothetical protein [Candidatus Bathyarchaeota archaeon]
MAEHDGEDTLHSKLQTPPESSPEFPVPLKEGARISDLKVEVPLTGFVERCQGDREDVVLKDALNSVTSLCGEASVTVNDVEKMADKASFLTAEIAVQVQDASERTRRQVEQERLGDPGSSRRVPIPVMDFTIPEPVWKKLGTAVSHFRSVGLFTQEIIGKRIKSDAGEERKLRWRPLNGSSGKVSLTERIVVDSGKLERLLDIPDDMEADGMKMKCLFSRRTLRFLSDP